MKQVLRVLGVLSCMVPSLAIAETMAEMETACQQLVKDVQPPGEKKKIRVFPTFGAGRCWGAFGAIQELGVLAIEPGNRLLQLCIPEGTTRLQLIKIFLKRAERYPERGNKRFGTEAWEAIHDAYPCK